MKSHLAQQFSGLLLDLGCSSPKEQTPEALACEQSLHEFYKHAWGVLEPGTPFIDNWHIHAICEHLEALYRRDIRSLLVNMPPRFSKSTLCSVTFPAWIWVLNPSFRSVFSSYSAALSTRDSVQCRRIIMSPWYQANWGHRFKLTTDQNVKQKYENDKTGVRTATSVGATMTGEGGDLLGVDDPLNSLEANSQAARQTAIEWWSGTMSTRLNDPKTGIRLVVMQRLHHEDLAGYLLSTGDWYHLNLPMEFTGVKPQWVIGWTDPREQESELIWPERYPRDEVDKLKRELGSYGAAAQLQQEPTPAEGGVFKKAWFREYVTPPPFLRVVESWDTATSESELAAYSVGTVWGEAFNGDIYLLDVVRERFEFPALKRAVQAMHIKWGGVAILVEDKSSGRQVCQELGSGTRLPVLPVKVGRADKVTRALAVSPVVEAGHVYIPMNAPWLASYMQELLTFPKGKTADQVDSSTQAITYLRGGGSTSSMDLS
jgi:predicted phage terminase large subunit-like protein